MAKTKGRSVSQKKKQQQRSIGLPKGVAQRASGKFGVEIKNPITNQREWLGTHDTVAKAENACKQKASKFERVLNGCISSSASDSDKVVDEAELLSHAARSTEDCSSQLDIFKDLPDICSASELHLPSDADDRIWKNLVSSAIDFMPFGTPCISPFGPSC